MNKGELTGFLYDLCLKHGFHLPGWEARLNKTLDQVDDAEELNRYEHLDSKCHKLAFGRNKTGEKVWSCVAWSESGTVKVRLLGKKDSLVRGKCLACGRDREHREGLRERDDRIIELEDKIQMKARQTNKVPICNGGAILTDEGSAFRSCRKRPGQTVNIETFCRHLTGGGTLPCALFAHVSISEGPR